MRNETVMPKGTPTRVCTALVLILLVLIGGCSTKRKTARRSVATGDRNLEISIVPKPASITPTDGHFELNRETKIVAIDDESVRAARALNDILTEKYAFTLVVTDDTDEENSITLSTDPSAATEAYVLKIDPSSIEIKGSERGLFYGIQSLIQLLPSDFIGEAAIPAAEILDTPRFRYRGMHLDVARHFMPVEFVKKFIKLISRYKYNYFHWHLTDDQGWRIEVKKYPHLTGIGSKRRETAIAKSYKQRAYVGDRIRVEGYYTQEQIRDVVAYAKARYVTIIPEIDMPGHSSSALASYPELGCRKNFPYKVQTTWGAFPDIYCPTESTFQFIQDVLSEVIVLFPDSPYVHIGGDEVMTDSWRTSKFVQDLKRSRGLASEAQVQGWFIKRVHDFLSANGKKSIVWDDMLDAGLPPNATVMSWRRFGGAVKSAVKAARAKHDVIMSPDDFTYFDHPQADSRLEPLSIGSPISLNKVYYFEPVPAELSQGGAEYIIGAQGCLWTEFMKTPTEVEYMMFPRAIALAEVLWSKREDRDFSAFSKRLNKELHNLNQDQVVYRRPEALGVVNRDFIAQDRSQKKLAETNLEVAPTPPVIEDAAPSPISTNDQNQTVTKDVPPSPIPMNKNQPLKKGAPSPIPTNNKNQTLKKGTAPPPISPKKQSQTRQL